MEMKEQLSVPAGGQGVATANAGRTPQAPSAQSKAVIIVGPPWPRSGTARVIENQIQYYRARGFYTVFVAVPFFWYYMYANETIDGMDELGADRIITAKLEKKRYAAAKIKASLRHAFRGTALDWQVAVGKAAQIGRAHV